MSNQKVRKLFCVIDGIGYGEVRNIQRVSFYRKGVGWLFVFYRENFFGILQIIYTCQDKRVTNPGIARNSKRCFVFSQ